jgi:hypothetical protein
VHRTNRDSEVIKRRWEPVVGLKAYLTGATAGGAMWGFTQQGDGSLVQGMPATEQYERAGNLGASFSFTRDGKTLDISPNDLLAILSEAADDITDLLDEIGLLKSLLLAKGMPAAALYDTADNEVNA